MQTKSEQKFPNLEDATNGMNRQQRRSYERRVKGLTPEQKREIDEKIASGNVTNKITHAWNKAIASAMVNGMDFLIEKYYTEFVLLIDEKGLSASKRTRFIESLLSEIRLQYANTLKRKSLAEPEDAKAEDVEKTPDGEKAE